jgi:hypothetical protein
MTIKNLSLICAPVDPHARPRAVPETASNSPAWRTRSLAAARARSLSRIAHNAVVLELASLRAMTG